MRPTNNPATIANLEKRLRVMIRMWGLPQPGQLFHHLKSGALSMIADNGFVSEHDLAEAPTVETSGS